MEVGRLVKPLKIGDFQGRTDYLPEGTRLIHDDLNF